MKPLFKMALRMAYKAGKGRGVQLDFHETYALLQLPAVKELLLEHELNRVKPSPDANDYSLRDNALEYTLTCGVSRAWDPPICYLPITGPAPEVALLNRCGLTDKGCTKFSCCVNCWSLRDSTGVTP